MEQHFDIDDLFMCPYCQGTLDRERDGLVCKSCGTCYPIYHGRQMDLRLQKSKMVDLSVEIYREMSDHPFDFDLMDINPFSTVDLSACTIPDHLSKALVSHFPSPKEGQNRVLDIGCGDNVHKNFLEQMGYEWVGLDYFNQQAPILGDIHALPFHNERFDFVMAISMLHEIQYPQLAMQEILRVLKPGGRLIGTAPFLEPYYDTTYFHFSHMGIYSLLQSSGFQAERISPSDDWNALKALSTMALFPKMPGVISRWMVAPLSGLHRLWWKMGNLLTRDEASGELARIKRISGSTDFVARKPQS